MEKLKKLALSLTLISVLSASVMAGETSSPPCAPGETNSPPCPAQSVNEDPVVLGETLSPSAVPVVYVTDLAETLMWSLLLF